MPSQRNKEPRDHTAPETWGGKELMKAGRGRSHHLEIWYLLTCGWTRGQEEWTYWNQELTFHVTAKSCDWHLSLKMKLKVIKSNLFFLIVFPVVMYKCKSWTIKKVKHWRIDASELWCWRRLVWAPWTARKSNQSILTEISLNIHWKGCCWSWNSNTLAT